MTFGQSPYGEIAYGESPTVVITTSIALASAVAVGFHPVASGDVLDARLPLAISVVHAYAPAVSDEAIIPVPYAVAVARAITPRLSGVTLTIPVARAKAAALAPTVTQVIAGGTDSTNALDGRSRGGLATGTITVPVAATPPTLTLGTKVDKAIAYPDPDMVDGRPT